MLDLDSGTLIVSVVWSIIGIAYCSYGRKNSIYFLYSGIVLLIFPFFVNNFWWLLGIGSVLVVLPYILNR